MYTIPASGLLPQTEAEAAVERMPALAEVTVSPDDTFIGRFCAGRTPRLVALGAVGLGVLTLAVHAPRAGQTSIAPEVRSQESPPAFQFHSQRNLVTVRVVVRDPRGRTVAGLRSGDFRVFEDGKLQQVSSFTVETAGGDATDEVPPSPAAQPGEMKAPPPVSASAVPQRFVGLYFDDLHLPLEEVARTREAAWQYVATEVEPEDRVGLFTASGYGDSEFSDDRSRLREEIFRLAPRSRGAKAESCLMIDDYESYLINQLHAPEALAIAHADAVQCDCAEIATDVDAAFEQAATTIAPGVAIVGGAGSGSSGDFSAAVSADPCAYNAKRRSEILAAEVWSAADTGSRDALNKIERAVARLAGTPGQRTLVLVSPGFLTETHSTDVDAIIRNALRHDVVISAIDAAGLAAEVPHRLTNPGRPDLLARKDLMIRRGTIESTNVLASLSTGTGGVFYHDHNDFGEGFHEAAAAPEVAYVLSFSPESFKLDGKFHALEVTLNRREPWSVEARRGYFDPTQELAQQAPGQDELDKVMFSQDEFHALPVEVTAQVGKSAQPPSTLTVVIHVDLRDLQFRKEADRSVNRLTFDTALFDREGKYVSGKEESLDLHLKDESLQQFAASGIYAKTSFEVPAGEYRVREVVRDSVAQQMSALNCTAQVHATTARAVAPASASMPESSQAP